jgi:integrin alpha FG-GAP repeat containing protein 1
MHNQEITLNPSNAPMKYTVPFVADVTGTLAPSLIGYTENKELGVWYFNPGTRTFNYAFTDIGKESQKCEPVHPHSNAFIDLNGDCLADIFIVCKKQSKTVFQVWVNQKSRGFTKALEQDLPDGAGPITFADIGV